RSERPIQDDGARPDAGAALRTGLREALRRHDLDAPAAARAAATLLAGPPCEMPALVALMLTDRAVLDAVLAAAPGPDPAPRRAECLARADAGALAERLAPATAGARRTLLETALADGPMAEALARAARCPVPDDPERERARALLPGEGLAIRRSGDVLALARI